MIAWQPKAGSISGTSDRLCNARLDASGVWRYREMLDVFDGFEHVVTLLEGNTPSSPAPKPPPTPASTPSPLSTKAKQPPPRGGGFSCD